MALTRRELLVAGGAGLVLAACGGGKDGGDEAGSKAKDDLILYAAFNPQQPVGKEVRLPLAVALADGTLDLDAPPRVLDVSLRAPDGALRRIGTVDRHARGIPRGYYPVHATFAAAGTWTFVVTAGGQRLTADIEAVPADQLPAVPGPGDRLPRIPTPTVADKMGLVALCTRDEQCPYHATSLDQAFAKGGPILLLVSTPAYCQTAICGPVLELLVARRQLLADAGATVIHAEVYADDQAKVPTDIVNTLGLTYEPALFVAAPDGTVNDRLDYTFDATELDDAINRIVA